MPTRNGVEVWIEDSEHKKLNHQEVVISLVDDRTVAVNTEMSRGELYTVHSLSPVSVFCDVFVTTASRVRKRAARFYLDKDLAVSGNASGSSADHMEGKFRNHGLRTPKKQFQHGKLGSLEVEVRRIGDIIKGEPRKGSEADRDEDNTIEFSMMDDLDQPPWIVFRFDIHAKQPPTARGSPTKRPRRLSLPGTLKCKNMTMSDRDPKTPGMEAPGDEPDDECRFTRSSKKRRMEHSGVDRTVSIDDNPTGTDSDQLQQKYEKEVAEEQRLLQKLQEQLQAKKTRNTELRRLLGEA